MTRKLKVLFLAAIALTAVAAITASAAQATITFTNPNGGNTVLTTTPDGTGTAAHHVFDTAPSPITCAQVHLRGTTAVTQSTEQTMEIIAYTGCEFLGVSVTVKPNGCAYIFNVNGTVTLECPTGKEVEFESNGCLVKVPAQGPLAGITYHNLNLTELTVSVNVTGISYTVSGCLFGNGSHTDGKYTTGNTIVTGEEDPSGAMKPVQVD